MHKSPTAHTVSQDSIGQFLYSFSNFNSIYCNILTSREKSIKIVRIIKKKRNKM